MITVGVSGGFDPVHIGHLKLLGAAKALGDRLVVILNNDPWVKKKKGYVFMDQEGREAVLRAIRYVDDVVLTAHPDDPQDMSVCGELRGLRPDIFANGGDRKADNIPEYKLCQKLGIKMAFNVGGEKTQSSSELVRKVKNLNVG